MAAPARVPLAFLISPHDRLEETEGGPCNPDKQGLFGITFFRTYWSNLRKAHGFALQQHKAVLLGEHALESMRKVRTANGDVDVNPYRIIQASPPYYVIASSDNLPALERAWEAFCTLATSREAANGDCLLFIRNKVLEWRRDLTRPREPDVVISPPPAVAAERAPQPAVPSVEQDIQAQAVQLYANPVASLEAARTLRARACTMLAELPDSAQAVSRSSLSSSIVVLNAVVRRGMINVLETRQELCEDDAWEKLVDLWSLKFEWRQSADEQPTAECREDFSSMLPYLNDRLLAQSQAWLATLRPDALLTRVTQDVLPYVMCRSDDLDASIVPTVLFALGLVSSGQPNEFQVSLRDALSAMWDRVQAEARRLGRANIVQQRYTAAIDLCLTGLTRRIAEAPPAPNAASLLETDCENVLRRIRAVRHMPDRTPRELLSEVWRARFLLEAELGTRSHFSSHLAPLIHCEVEAVAEAWLGTLDAKTLVDDGLVDIVEGIIFHGSPREVLLLDLIWYRIGRLSEGQPLDYQRRLRSHLERVLADVRTKARAPTAAGCASSVEHFDSATRFALTGLDRRIDSMARADGGTSGASGASSGVGATNSSGAGTAAASVGGPPKPPPPPAAMQASAPRPKAGEPVQWIPVPAAAATGVWQHKPASVLGSEALEAARAAAVRSADGHGGGGGGGGVGGSSSSGGGDDSVSVLGALDASSRAASQMLAVGLRAIFSPHSPAEQLNDLANAESDEVRGATVVGIRSTLNKLSTARPEVVASLVGGSRAQAASLTATCGPIDPLLQVYEGLHSTDSLLDDALRATDVAVDRLRVSAADSQAICAFFAVLLDAGNRLNSRSEPALGVRYKSLGPMLRLPSDVPGQLLVQRIMHAAQCDRSAFVRLQSALNALDSDATRLEAIIASATPLVEAVTSVANTLPESSATDFDEFIKHATARAAAAASKATRSQAANSELRRLVAQLEATFAINARHNCLADLLEFVGKLLDRVPLVR